MRFDIFTIFPEFFGDTAHGIFAEGVVARALRSGIATAQTHDLRRFTSDRHRTVDDRPFGGGEGMVLKPQPIFDCAVSLQIRPKASRDTGKESVILMSAQGKRFTQATARRLATLDHVVLICGRYEGVDERVAEHLCDEELCIGDYVLSGGELAAAVVLDATVRLLPGVLGHADSSRYESFGDGDPGHDEATSDGVPRSTQDANGLLDYPHYTRPAEFAGHSIPAVLADGDHVKIRRWRRQAALAKTLANRPDLLIGAELDEDDRLHLDDLSQRA
jgi:tRNA (guanine37-N1)-methyltransferase